MIEANNGHTAALLKASATSSSASISAMLHTSAEETQTSTKTLLAKAIEFMGNTDEGLQIRINDLEKRV